MYFKEKHLTIKNPKTSRNSSSNLINHVPFGLAVLQFGEEQIYRSLRDESPPSDVRNGPGYPLIGGSAEKRKLTEKLSFRPSNDYGEDGGREVARSKKHSVSGNSGAVTLASTPIDHYTGYDVEFCLPRE